MNKIINTIKEKITPVGKTLNAQTAHNLSRFGNAYTNEELITRMIERIEELIQAKAESNYYSLIYDLDETLGGVNSEVMNHFVSLGFTCVILDNTVHKDIKNTCLYINWK